MTTTRKHRSKREMDEILRNFALDNLRTIVARLRDGDPAVHVKDATVWRERKLARAARWAAVAEALRPDEPEPTKVKLSFDGPPVLEER